MIDKIGDFRIRETNLEETTQANEQPAQDNIAPEAEPIVTATPEFKAGLIAEQHIGGQAQELLLRNRLDSQIPPDNSDEAAFQNDTRNPTFKRAGTEPAPDKTVGDFVSDTIKQIPGQLNRTLGEIGEALSHPGEVISEAVEEAKRKF
jgi:hypothetical protein